MTNPILAAARKPKAKAAIQNEGANPLSGQPIYLFGRPDADTPTNEPLEATSVTPEPMPHPTTTETAEVPANDPSEIQADKGDLVAMLKGCKLAEHAVDVAAVVKMPRDTAILCALGIASAVVGMAFKGSYQYGGTVPLGLYVACEQPPATGKSSVISMLQNPIFSALKKLPTSHPAFLSDATSEAIESTLRETSGHFMLASTEQAMINTLLGLSYNTGKSNNSLILEGYSGDWHSSARVTRSGFSGHVHGSVVIISQDGAIDSILGVSNGTGIAERFFILSEPDLLGTRDHRKGHRRNKALEESYQAAIEKVCCDVGRGLQARMEAIKADNEKKAEDLQAQIEQAEGEDDKELIDDLKKQLRAIVKAGNPKTVPLTALSQLIDLRVTAADWDRINIEKNTIESMIARGGKFESSLMRSYAGKFDQRVVKVAAILHVIESYMAGGEEVSQNIESRFVDVAIRLCNWANESVYQAAMAKEHIGRPAEHEKIIGAIVRAGDKPLTLRDLIMKCKNYPIFKVNRNGASKAIKAAVEELVDTGALVHTHQMRGSRKVVVFQLGG